MDKELKNTINNEIGYIVLISGTDENSEDIWCYASIEPSKFKAFKEAEESGEFEVEEYGEVLFTGKGTTPPPEIEQKMRDEFGADDEFEDNVGQVIKKLSREISPFKF
tara:strand:+ start:91 stop:414 length:324 start_codon:yes stop_codon:yes gene_type:complete